MGVSEIGRSIRWCFRDQYEYEVGVSDIGRIIRWVFQ